MAKDGHMPRAVSMVIKSPTDAQEFERAAGSFRARRPFSGPVGATHGMQRLYVGSLSSKMGKTDADRRGTRACDRLNSKGNSEVLRNLRGGATFSPLF